jgi:hypothetical protein
MVCAITGSSMAVASAPSSSAGTYTGQPREWSRRHMKKTAGARMPQESQ